MTAFTKTGAGKSSASDTVMFGVIRVKKVTPV